MLKASLVSSFTVVVAENQTEGKGQMGSVWETEKGSNLTFSVFVEASFLKIEHQFYLNCAIAVAIFNTLKKFQVPNLHIKWPNDILSDNKKISGVLIENTKTKSGNNTIIGIGLNVNQLQFPTNFKATSMKKQTGVLYNLDEVLQLFLQNLKLQINRLQLNLFDEVYADYDLVLFKKNKPATFKNATGKMFTGYIKGVTKNGLLQVLLEDEIIKEFRLKEIQLLY